MFGKPKTTADEIVKAIANLSEEEKKKIFEQSFKDRVDESVAGQEESADTQDSQSDESQVVESEGEAEAPAGVTDVAEADTTEPIDGAETPAEETETEDAELAEPEKQLEVDDAQEARISALEGKLAELMELVSKGDEAEFGQKAQAIGQEDESIPNDEKIMNKYYKNSRNYK